MSGGFTYTALLAAIVILGITSGAATKYWHQVTVRDKEEELLFRGNQYRTAIERYYSYRPNPQYIPQYPTTIEDIIKDSRTVEGKRYLRQKYKDPITGEDFVELRDAAKRLIGVYSPSEKQPVKQGNFSEENRDFEGKKKYSDWKFQVIQRAGPQGQVPPPVPVPPPGGSKP
jgi:type II secretory pathway pseudopilin PulG